MTTQPTAALCQSPHCRRHGDDRPNRRAMPASPLCDICVERCYEDWQTVRKVWGSTIHGLTHQGSGMSEKVKGTPTYGLSLDEKAVERRAKVIEDLRFWVHLLIEDERIANAPNLEDVPAMAKVVGTHLGHLVKHHDEHLAVCVAVDARKAAKSVRQLSAPQRSRTYRPGIPCVEHTEDDMGQRVPCPGDYRARLEDVVVDMPDLLCSEDSTHRLTPAGFRRLGRQFHKAGAEKLLSALGVESGKVGA